MVGQPSNKPLRRHAFAAGLAPIAVLAGAVTLLNPGDQLERGLSLAAAAEARLIAEAAPSTRPATTAVANRSFEEGSEGFWLTRAPEEKDLARVTWTAPVAAGDRVVVNFGAYDREILDIVSVEQESAATRIDTGDGNPVRYVVTGRRLAAPGADLVRLTIDQDGRGLTPVAGAQDRAL